MMNLACSRLPVSSSFLLAGLVVGLVACSSDSDKGDAPCVTVNYYAADGTKEGEGSCVDFPSACANADDPCGGDDAACYDALKALCKDGSTRNGCFSSSLNDNATSMELSCQRP